MEMPNQMPRTMLSVAVFFVVATSAFASDRVALVIGNSSYKSSPLVNPSNDANAMADLLGKAGFSVTKQLDTNLIELQGAVDRFGATIRDPKVKFGLFYYAGHGFQQDWRNYLVPVSASIRTSADVPKQTVDVSHLLRYMEQSQGRSFLIILDACRDDPFAGAFKPPVPGLSQFDAPVGSLLAYATAPGKVASDGDGKNGLYTGYLLREFAVQGARLEDAFKRVRLSVRLASKGAQVPWESTSLEEDLYLFPHVSRSWSEADRDQFLEQEMTAWRRVKGTNDPEVLAGFIREYPSGSASELAQSRMNRLLAAVAAQERQRQQLAVEEAAKAKEELAAREEAARLQATKAEAARVAAQKAELERVRLAQIETEKVEAKRQQAAKEAAALAELARKAAETERLAQEELKRVAEYQQTVKLAEAKAELERVERARLESQRQKELARLATAEEARLTQERVQRDKEARQQAEKLAEAKVQADRVAEHARQSELQAQRAKADLERLHALQVQQEAEKRTKVAQAEAAREEAARLAVAQQQEEASRLAAAKAADAERLAQEELRRVVERDQAVKLVAANAELERVERARLESQRQKELELLAAAEEAKLAQERAQRDKEARQQAEKLAEAKAQADRIAEHARQSELQAQRARADLERLHALQAQQEAEERAKAAQAEAARADAARLAVAQQLEEAARLDAMRQAQLAQASEEQSQVALAPTPFFKGYDEHWRPYSLGDEFHMRVIDRHTGAEKPLAMKVTQVDSEGGQVFYNGGEFVSDMMGNTTTNLRGSFSTPRQFYPAELMVGKKWHTRFKQSRPNGITYTFQYDLKVVGKERITVPAGTFDAYKIEARGFNVELSAYLERNIWVAPGVNSDIAHEILVRLRNGAIDQYDRQELVSYVQAKH
jgi:uncharacterized caspase-like protein